MAIQFSNLASSLLASGVSSTATSISVNSASSFPSLGGGDYFYATIGAGAGSEIVKVTGISGTTFTVVRGQDDTTAVSHSAGVDVALRVTAGTLEDLRDGGQVYTAGSGISLSGNEFSLTDKSNYDTAYGWGDHAQAGYLTSNTTYTAGSGITLTGTEFSLTDKDDYDTAYGWGDHAQAGYLTSYTDTNTTYSAGTGVTLTGTTFSLTDTNSKLNLSGGTLTGDLSVEGALTGTIVDSGDVTMMTLHHDVGSDLSTQKSFIDFSFEDDNTNETPQVRIGAVVGQNTNADSQVKEGSGAFVVYTNNAESTSGDAGASLTEKFRVDYVGNTTVSGTITATGGNSTNWNTAYGWGDHSTAGYLTSYTDTNTTYSAGTGITLTGTEFSLTDKDDYDTAYGWGDHADAGYLTSHQSLSGYATETYVDTAVSDLVDSSPSTLNTLNELAAALGDDANFSTTVTNSIATKLPLAGGTLTGDLNMGSNVISVDTVITEGVIYSRENDQGVPLESGLAYFSFNHNQSAHPTTEAEFDLMERGSITTFKDAGTWDNSSAFTLSADSYLSEFHGYLLITTAGDYRFGVNADDSVDFFIDGIRVADDYGGHGATAFFNDSSRTSIYLSAGYHKLFARFEEVGGGDSVELGWNAGSGTTISAIPSSALWHNATDRLKAQDGKVRAVGDFYIGASGDNKVWHEGTLTTTNKSNYDTAYGWGNHASAGYLTSYTDTNTTYSAGTGITLTGTEFSLTDTNAKLNLSGGTMTGKISMFQNNDIFGLSGTIANYPRLSFYSSEGTHAAKTQTLSGDLIGQIDFNPHTGSSYTGGGKISFISTEAITSSQRGTEARIYSTKTGQSSLSYHQFKDDNLYIKNVGGATHKYWHAGNDGGGSGLDADKLDGVQASQIIYGNSSTGTSEGTFTDWNSINKSGFYSDDGASNKWSTANWSSVLHHRLYSSNNRYSTQLGFDTYNNNLYTRTNNNNTWTSWEKIWHSGVDGSGSGLDADLLDGQHGSYYAPASHNHSGVYLPIGGKAADSELLDGIDSSRVIYGGNATGTYNANPTVTSSPYQKSGFYDVNGTGNNAPTNTYYSYINMRHTNTANNHGHQIAGSFYSQGDIYNRQINNNSYGSWSKIWNTTNDGSGSGLDADLLDGQHGSYYYSAANPPPTYSKYLRSDTNDTKSGNLVLRTSGAVTNSTTGLLFEVGGSYTDGRYRTRFRKQDVGGGIPLYIDQSGSTANSYTAQARFGTYSGNNYEFEVYGDINATGNIYDGGNAVWHAGNDGSGSGLDADLLDGKDHTNFGATLATYGTTSGTGGRIRCTAPFNTNSGHMFQVTVSLYTSYAIHNYVVAGYMYSSTNQWYSPTVIYSGAGTPDIKLGRDSNGKAYISIARGSYTGVRVHNMTRGYYTSVADTYDPWTITENDATENSVTPTVSKVWHSTNDGSGSGLDADLLDGQHGSYYYSAGNPPPTYSKYLRSDTSDTMDGTLSLHGNLLLTGDPTTTNAARTIDFTGFDKEGTTDTSDRAFIQHTTNTGGHAGAVLVISSQNDSNDGIAFATNSSSQLKHNSNTIWTAGNDGSGSGLDADKLDGQHGSYYAPASHNHNGVYTPYDHFRHTGHGNYTSTTTSALLTEALGDDAFDSKLTAHKTSWDYAGNGDLTDAGRLTELAGTSWLWWTDNSTDNVQGNITGLAIAPNTGGSAGKMFVYNNQGSSYGPGWREIWTSTSDGSGSGLDADTVDGIHASSFIQSGGSWNATNMPGSRHTGISVNGGEVVFQRDNPSNGQMSVMVDGNFYAGENNGFWSLYSGNNYNNKVGMYSNTSGHLLLSTSSAYAGGNKLWHAGNDGSGSGLDADTVDGQHASAFATTSGNVTGLSITGLGNNNFTYGQTSGTLNGYTGWAGHLISNHGNGSNYYMQDIILPFWGSPKISRRQGSTTVTGPYDIWTSENDGSGSGLDADTCDGQHLGTSAAVQFGSVLSTGNVTAYSDRRIKENITPITEALSKVQRLTGNTYTRNDQKDTATKYAGLIAQEVEDVLPEAVREADDGIKALDYNATIALLVESIKELKAEVDDLKTQLENK